MKCHFVYSIPINSWQDPIQRIERRVRNMLGKMGLPVRLVRNRHPEAKDFKDWPIQSPYENTKHIYNAIAEKMPTVLYHLTERVECNLKEEDIFLGHPYFPYTARGIGVTEIVIGGKVRPRILALITPLHCNIHVESDHINVDFLNHVDRLMPKVDILFAIMGEYWWDQWDSSPYAHWKKKMIRLDMAVDTNAYAFVKKRFNSKGERGYLYIGNSVDHRKGTALLANLFEGNNSFIRGWIGLGPEIPNVPKISEPCSLTPELMTTLANKYDFFVSPAIADPNPTTILESMAWGFPVICTPQSGYYETSYRKNIYYDDIERSKRILNELQYADDTILRSMSEEARGIVSSKYTWQRMTSNILLNMNL